ncbi:hypothetical protein K439DRAFT_1513241 [Ramaria rubella]|nr:hypothetical protein K439DRAFT_1513241 [Ramaria rubella]
MPASETEISEVKNGHAGRPNHHFNKIPFLGRGSSPQIVDPGKLVTRFPIKMSLYVTAHGRHILCDYSPCTASRIVETTRYPFLHFCLSAEEIDDKGEVGALNQAFEVIFGFKSRSTGDGIILILKCGPSICAVANVLGSAVKKFPQDTILLKWIEDLISAATKASKDNTPTVARPLIVVKLKAHEPEVSDDGESVHEEQLKVPGFFERLVDKPSRPPAKLLKQNTGCKKGSLLNEVAIPCKDPTTGKGYWRCAAEGCKKTGAGNVSNLRVLAHCATECRKIIAEKKNGATDALIALDAKKGSKSTSLKALGQLSCNDSPSMATISTSTVQAATSSHQWFQNATQAGQEELQSRIDTDIMLLICVGGLVPALVDCLLWKNFMANLNPQYKPPSSTFFCEKKIPMEAARVCRQQVEELSTCENLTLTFDGGSTWGQQSVYMVHITTPDRVVYFVDGDEAKYIKDVLEPIVRAIGPKNFAATGSDNTGNTHNAHQDLVEIFPTISNFADVCHHINLTIGDITKLPFFKEGVSRLSEIITYFSKSYHANAALKEIQKEEGVAHGLEKIGNTRFGMVAQAVNSLIDCYPLIQKLIQDKCINTKYFTHPRISLEFQLFLSHYSSIITPLAKAIKTLESTHTTPADVFMLWLVILAMAKELFEKPPDTTGIPHGFANKNLNNPKNVDYLKSDIIKQRNPQASGFTPSGLTADGQDDSQFTPFLNTYKQVKEYLKKVMQEELRAGYRPFLKQLGVKKAVEKFCAQLMAYSRREWPFNAELQSSNIVGWWRTLSENPEADVLSFLAIKLYSICPNSMADERTASTFTWLNSAVRNRQLVKNIVNMVHIWQCYMREHKEGKLKEFKGSVIQWEEVKERHAQRLEVLEKEADMIGEDSDNVTERANQMISSKGKGKVPCLLAIEVSEELNLEAKILLELLAEGSARGSNLDVFRGEMESQIEVLPDDDGEPNYDW